MRNISMVVAAAFLLSSAAFAGGPQLTPATEIFQYGDSMYAWDPESGGAVRVGAVWDGFAPATRQAAAMFQEGDYIVERDPQSGEKIRVGAVWDGAVPSHSSMVSALALKR